MVGQNTLRKIMGELSKKGNLSGFFTNHSLRRSGTTRLFQACMDRKIVKELTGHQSDAIDAYQITSDEQRQTLSEIIAGRKEKVQECDKSESCNLEVVVGDVASPKTVGCACMNRTIKASQSEEIGKMISELISKKRGQCATIKLEIAFDC